jgi:predicted nucleotidyltransferase
MIAAAHIRRPSTLEQTLDAARRRIEVSMPELTEARRRRDLIAEALRAAFPGCRIYVNGSVAHGDALTPLTDVDVGIIVPDLDHLYGPGKYGPKRLKERVAAVIREVLGKEYPKLRVIVEGRKRSILVSFGNPVAMGEKDFTADVIVAIDNRAGDGLHIPRYDTWDRSHPEKHTEMVRVAVKNSEVAYSHGVRLLKHWARRHDKPLCSWHIKALALACLATPVSQLAGMLAWFEHAIADLSVRDTPDPAGVAGAIKLSISRTELVEKLTKAREKLACAIEFDAAGYDVLARDELAKFFKDEDMLPRENPITVLAQQRRRAEDQRRKRTSPALLTGVRHRERTPTRSWAP